MTLTLHPDTGWLLPQHGVQYAPSPNFNARPANSCIDLLVLHNISLPPNVFEGDAVVHFFQNQLDIASHPWFENIRGMTVSAHFFVRRNGDVVQFVSTFNRAWHAGASLHQGRESCNDFSVGIEVEGSDFTPFTAEQYHRLAQLNHAIAALHPIRSIRGHEHIAPQRKTDPGPFFDWSAYQQASPWPVDYFPDLRRLSVDK